MVIDPNHPAPADEVVEDETLEVPIDAETPEPPDD